MIKTNDTYVENIVKIRKSRSSLPIFDKQNSMQLSFKNFKNNKIVQSK